MSVTRGSFRRALRHRRWRRLLVSYAVSLTGDMLYAVAFVATVADRSDNPATWLGAAVIARMVAYIVLSPIGGVLADRLDRRRLMFNLNVARAVVMGTLAVAVWVGVHPVMLVIGVTLNSALSAPYQPAATATTPLLVTEDDLAAANAAEGVVTQLGYFAGPALGALVVAVSNPATGLVLNAATYLIGAALLVGIGDLGGGAAAANDDGASADRPRLLAGVADGVRTMRSTAGLTALVGFVASLVFMFGFEQIGHLLVADQRLGLGAEGVGLMGAALGLGGLLSAPLAARFGSSPNAARLLTIAGLVTAIAVAVLGITRSPVVAFIVLAAEGVGVMILEVCSVTLLQRGCPADQLATVYGVQDSIASAAQLVGSLAAPILFAVTDIRTSMFIAAAVVLAGTLWSAPGMQRLVASTDAERRHFRPLVERLARIELFHGAPHASLERLARTATLGRVVTAGEAVVRVNDPAEDVYLIDSGRFAALDADGHTVGPPMTADEWFGEIGVLRRQPRSATVVCQEPGTLTVLDGSVIAEVFAVPGALSESADRTIRVRLARTHPQLEP